MSRLRGPPIDRVTVLKWGLAAVILLLAFRSMTVGLWLALLGLVLVVFNRRLFLNLGRWNFELKPGGGVRRARPRGNWDRPLFGTSRRRR